MSPYFGAAPKGQRRIILSYVLMLVASLVAFLVIRHVGESRHADFQSSTAVVEASAPSSANAVSSKSDAQSNISEPAAKRSNTLFHVLLALAAVIATGRLLGMIFRFVGQPPVIGEVLAGILLGPSLLGRISPDIAAFLLPESVGPGLGLVAQLGVILYMFVVGLELDTESLREHGHATVAISHASIVAPFLLGAMLALALAPRFAEGHVSFTVFALFLGAAMSVTAFPVLARILSDRQMTRTSLGVLALTCAATDDVTAWCLLAFVVGVAQAKIGAAVLVMGLTLVYIVVMLVVVRPAIHRWARRYDEHSLNSTILSVAFILLLASTLTTEAIGIHAIFGAFFLGAIFPHDSAIARDLSSKLKDVVTILLLPAFFAFTGMRTQLGLITGAENWFWCVMIIVVATLGKFGGSFLAARLTGLGWRDASCLGILMNTRGLMELIVLNVGLDLKIISPTIFAMMVIMAIVTTLATTPVLQYLARRAALAKVAPETASNHPTAKASS